MKELSTKDMTEYLKCIINLESSIYCQRQARANIRAIYEDRIKVKKRNLRGKKCPIEKRKIEEIIKPEDPRATRTINPIEVAKANRYAGSKVMVKLGIFSILIGLGFRLLFILLSGSDDEGGVILGTISSLAFGGIAAFSIVYLLRINCCI